MSRNDDAIERLSKKLSAKNVSDGVRRSPLAERGSHARHEWSPAPQNPRRKSPRRFGAFELLFGVSAVFFIIAAFVSVLLFVSGNNTVSTRNVDVAVSGPTEIGAGETLSLQIVVTNRNAVPLELADLIVEFPEGTRSDADVSVELPRIRESLGTIEAGESINRTVRAVVFGESGSDLAVQASVEYRVPSSNAVFVSDTTYLTKLNKSPASIVVDVLKEAVSGQSFSFTVSVFSNAPDTLRAMLLLVEYPPGFSFISSTPVPVSGTAAWNIGDIEPGGKRSITIKGMFAGEDGDERVLRFTAGSKKEGRDDVIAAPLATGTGTVTVAKPFVSISLALDGSVSSEQVVERGREIRGDIRWTNNLPVRVQDVEIELAMNGAILDRSKVKAEQGFFRSGNQTITWSKETQPKLADVAPGVSDVASFTFSTLPQTGGLFRNPELNLIVTVRARRLSESNVPEVVESTAKVHVSVATDLILSSILSRGTVFTESGPIPPKADTESTYTVQWIASNSTNAVANASVSAVLPSYVRWVGATSPSGADISFNPVGGIITWNIGDVSEGGSKTAAFQIAITPSISQVGTAPTLVGNQRIYGFDRFSRTNREGSAPSLTTDSFSAQNGRVAP